jgi:hypothetical protein
MSKWLHLGPSDRRWWALGASSIRRGPPASQSWKYSNRPIIDKSPFTSLNQLWSKRASTTMGNLWRFKGTTATTSGARSLKQHPNSHLSEYNSVLAPLSTCDYKATLNRGTSFGWTLISKPLQGWFVSIFWNHSHSTCKDQLMYSRLKSPNPQYIGASELGPTQLWNYNHWPAHDPSRHTYDLACRLLWWTI